MHLAVLTLVTLLPSLAYGVGHGDLITPKQLRELEYDLRTNAQFACAKSIQYTTLNSNLVFADHQFGNPIDDVLRKFTALPNESRVVHIHVSDEEIAKNSRLPVTLTGANVGIGLGKSNGTMKAKEFISANRKMNILPKHHVRQNGSQCVMIGQFAERGISSFYERLREDVKAPHLTILNNVALHDDGIVALECGLIQPSLGCGNRLLRPGRLWRKSITSSIQSNTKTSEKEVWTSMTMLSRALPNLPVHDEVFVISARWDYNFHHFLVESLTRLVSCYHYLQRYPHIKIHIRAAEMQSYNASRPSTIARSKEGKAMRKRVLELLDIAPERIVQGQLLARKLYLPNDIECSSSLRHGLDLQLLSRLFIAKAKRVVNTGACTGAAGDANHPQQFTSPRTDVARNNIVDRFPPVIVSPSQGAKIIVQARTCKDDWRCLNETVAKDVTRAAEGVFPHSEVVIANTSLSRGLGCDIDLYRSADVVIGVHGAAMTNAMFMRPGTILIEIIGEYDLRMTPVCGYHGPFAAVFGVHHYIYSYDGQLSGSELQVADLIHHAFEFYRSIRSGANYTTYDIAPVSYT